VKKILVVDDEANIRRLYTDELTDAGYRVLGAANWEEARRALDNERFDLVTLDIRMGEGPDGIEALRLIKELHPGLPVVSSPRTGVPGPTSGLGGGGYVVDPPISR
jgi:DNA-binding NtrC family response regulator